MPAPPEPLRIVLATGNYLHIVDGVSRTLNRTVAWLEERGHQVLVLGPRAPRPVLAHRGRYLPVPSIPAPGRPEYRVSLWLPRSVRREIDRLRPHLVHIATPDLLGLLVLRLARRRRIPVVCSFHTHFASYLRHYGLGRLEPLVWAYLRAFYRRAAQVYVPSPSMIDLLRAHRVGGDLRSWSRGVDAGRFHPARRSPEWRRGHGIGDAEVVVAFVSRLVREKGLDALVRLGAELEGKGVAHRLLVVGEGPERARLGAALPRAVFTGHLEGEELGRAYASADVFVFPSQSETFGNVTLEAMASGLPVAAADGPGSRSLVVEGVTGFLAPPEGLAGPVARLVLDPLLRAALGAAGRARAEGFDWEAALGALETHYREASAAAVAAPG